MVEYSIVLEIGNAGAVKIDGLEQQVTLVKSVLPAPAGLDPVIAWVATEPMGRLKITWHESYYVYAAHELTSANRGLTIDGLSSTDNEVALGKTYTYSEGAFDDGAPSTAAGTYEVYNKEKNSTMTMGLAQFVVVNGSQGTTPTPINASVVGYEETSQFTPEVKVSVFLQHYQNNGVVISEVQGDACTVTLTTETPTATLKFDADTNSFSQILSNELTLKHV